MTVERWSGRLYQDAHSLLLGWEGHGVEELKAHAQPYDCHAQGRDIQEVVHYSALQVNRLPVVNLWEGWMMSSACALSVCLYVCPGLGGWSIFLVDCGSLKLGLAG